MAPILVCTYTKTRSPLRWRIARTATYGRVFAAPRPGLRRRQEPLELITAMTVLAELGDISRFDSPRQLMAYLGLVPSEHSSGSSRRQGAITKTGNGHVRRVLVEAAWNYRFPARKTRTIEQRAEQTSAELQAIAWAGQKRLCGRYRRLVEAGKVNKQVTTAVARELAGFIWAIACEAQGKAHASRATARTGLVSVFGSGYGGPVWRTPGHPMRRTPPGRADPRT